MRSNFRRYNFVLSRVKWKIFAICCFWICSISLGSWVVSLNLFFSNPNTWIFASLEQLHLTLEQLHVSLKQVGNQLAIYDWILTDHVYLFKYQKTKQKKELQRKWFHMTKTEADKPTLEGHSHEHPCFFQPYCTLVAERPAETMFQHLRVAYIHKNMKSSSLNCIRHWTT